MIIVRCMGHIKTSIGKDVLELDDNEITGPQLIETIRKLARDDDSQPGFTKYNTLLVVNGEEAFTAASTDRLIRDGDDVFLVPFSHGG